MRLYDRIIRSQIKKRHIHPPMFEIPELRNEMRESYCTDVQNVAEWAAGKTFDDVIKDCPCCKLPFPGMWFEYFLEGIDKHIPNDPIEVSSHVGIHVTERENTLEFKMIDFDRNFKAINGTLCFLVHLKDNFSIGTYSALIPEWLHDKAEEEEGGNYQFREDAILLICPSLYAINFFHCKNVLIRQVGSNRIQPKHKDEKVKPQKGFNYIEVHRSSTRSKKDPHPGMQPIERASSMVRGHFKKHERLFGKRAGMWFWSAHVRGNGTPEKKDYRVWAPTPKHEPNCIINERWKENE